MAEPDVFAYLDYRAFLRDSYTSQRARRSMSFRALARRSRIRSSSFLKRVMDGSRNLAPETAERVGAAFGLEGDDRAYFETLVRFNQARGPTERSDAFARMNKFARFRRVHSLDLASDVYHSHWYLPVIRELAASPHFNDDPSTLARFVRPRITTSQARRALETLELLGLLVRGDDGHLRQTEALVTSGPETRSMHMAKFHHAMIGQAARAIDELPSEERDVSSLTLCVRADGLARIKKRVQDFRRELLDELGDESGAVQVVQLNFQLFPLSLRLDQGDSK